MKLQSQSNLIYLEDVTRTSKAGNQYTQVRLANTEAYENYTFFKSEDINTSQLKHGDQVTALLEVVPEGFRNSINLVGLIKKA